MMDGMIYTKEIICWQEKSHRSI